jgi:hypothetical protein
MKYYFKKNIIAWIIAVFVLGISAIIGFGSNGAFYDVDYMSIEEFKIDATINEDGSLDMVETITFDFDEGMSVIFKDIVYSKNGISKSDKSYLLEDSVEVKVINHEDKLIYDSKAEVNKANVEVGYSWRGDYDELGERITCADNRPNCESIFVRVPSGVYPSTTYQFSYTIAGAVSAYEDIAMLNWIFVDYQDFKVENIEVNINLPSNSLHSNSLYSNSFIFESHSIDSL